MFNSAKAIRIIRDMRLDALYNKNERGEWREMNKL